MNFWLGVAYLLGAGLVLGGVGIASASQKFFEKSHDLEKSLNKLINLDDSATNISAQLSPLLKEVVDKGKELVQKLSDRAKELGTIQEKA